jgi:hypothetical protein
MMRLLQAVAWICPEAASSLALCQGTSAAKTALKMRTSATQPENGAISVRLGAMNGTLLFKKR